MHFPFGSLHIKDLPFFNSRSKEVSGSQREKVNTVKSESTCSLYSFPSNGIFPLRSRSTTQVTIVSDPDPDWMRTNKKEKWKKFKVDWRAKRSLYRAGGFSYSFEIFHGGLRKKTLPFFILKCTLNFFNKTFLSPIFGHHKRHSNWYPDLEPGSLKTLDPDPNYRMYPGLPIKTHSLHE